MWKKSLSLISHLFFAAVLFSASYTESYSESDDPFFITFEITGIDHSYNDGSGITYIQNLSGVPSEINARITDQSGMLSQYYLCHEITASGSYTAVPSGEFFSGASSYAYTLPLATDSIDFLFSANQIVPLHFSNHTIFIPSELSKDISFSVRLDNTPPAVSYSLSNDTWDKKKLHYGVTAADGGSGIKSFQYLSPGGSVWAEYTPDVYFSKSGTYQFKATDNVENPFIYTAYIDITPPTVTEVTQSIDAYTNQNVALTASGQDDEDGSGIDYYQYSLEDTSHWQTGRNVVVGKNQTVYFRAVDKQGNISEVFLHEVTNIDKTPSVLTVTPTPSDALSGDWKDYESVNLHIHTTEEYSGFESLLVYNNDELEYDGPLEDLYTQSYNFDLTEQYDNKIRVVVTDRAGNKTIQEVPVYLDYTAPIISVHAITDGVDKEVWTGLDSINLSFDVISADHSSPLVESTAGYSINSGGWTTLNNTDRKITVTEDGILDVRVRITDEAGNTGVSDKFTLYVDHTPPELSFLSESYAQKDSEGNLSLNLSDFVINDTQSGASLTKGLSYRIDGGDYSDFTLSGGSFSADATGLDEGEHSIFVKALDNAGNEDMVSKTFLVDMTTPVIDDIAVNDGEDMAYGEYLAIEKPTVSFSSHDDYGEISHYEYFLSDRYLGNPASDDLKTSTENIFTLTGITEGTNYLYYRAVDKGGNAGSWGEMVLKYDATRPGIPGIKSLSHPKAENISDAVPYKDGVFLIKAGTTPGSGLSSYTYQLYKGQGGDPIAEGSLDASGDGRLDFTNLADNGEDEFYTLEVKAMGNNNKESLAASYMFRVDTSPPENLTVYVKPQSIPSVNYREGMALLAWQKPLDMSGVARYYLYTGDTPLDGLDAEGLTGEILSSWQSLDNKATGTTIDVRAILPDKEGRAYVYLCAEDPAGNRELTQTSFLYDRIAPVLPLFSGDEYFQIDYTRSDERILTLTHGEGSDNTGEIPSYFYRLYQVASEDGNSSLLAKTGWISSLQTSYTLDGLLEGEVYLFRLKVSDEAGNEGYYTKSFTLTEGEEPVIEIPEPFSADLAGFLINGSRTGSRITGVLTAVDEMGFTELVDGAPVGGESAFDTITFEGEDLVFASFAPQRTFRFSFQGFDFTASGVSFTPEEGLKAQEVTFFKELTHQDGEKEEKELSYQNLSLAYSPLTLFHSSSLRVESEGLDLVAGETWPLKEVASSYFQDEAWQLSGSELDTAFLWENNTAGLYTFDEGEKSYAVNIPLIGLSSLDGFDPAFLSAYNMELSGTTLVVNDSSLYEDHIQIDQSKLLLPQGFTPDPVTLADFSFYPDGTLKKGDHFSFSGFSYTDEAGNIFTITGVAFGKSRISFSGTYQTPGGEVFTISDLLVGEEGIRLEELPRLEGSYQFVIHDYLIETDDLYLSGDGYLIRTGEITLPVYWGGGKIAIEDLGVLPDKESVYQSGTSASHITLSGSAYGEDILIEGFTFSDETLIGSHVRTALSPGFELPGDEPFDFTDWAMYADGHSGLATQSFSSGSGVKLGSFDLAEGDLFFDGKSVQASVVLDLPSGFSRASASFTGYKAASGEISSYGRPNESLSYGLGGNQYILDDLQLEAEGLHGAATIPLPGYWNGAHVRYTDLIFLGDGTTNLGDQEGTGYAVIGGWAVRLEEPVFTDEGISFARGVVTLYDEMGGDELLFEDLTFSSSGDFTGGEAANENLSFLSMEGFVLEPETSRLTEEGIRMDGKISLSDAMDLGGAGHVTFDSDATYLLLGDGTVDTDELDETIRYRYGRIELEGSGIRFSDQGVSIQDSRIRKLPLGTLDLSADLPLEYSRFYGSGNLEYSERTYSDEPLTIFSVMGLDVSHYQLTDEGLALSGELSFAPLLGEDTLYFDSLVFTKEGKLESDSYIPFFTTDFFGSRWELYGSRIDGNGLGIGTVKITLPEELESGELVLKDIRVDQRGDIHIGKLDSPPYSLMGVEFYLNRVAYKYDTFDLGGNLSLPESMPGQLGGLSLKIDEFSIDMEEGEVETLDAGLERDLIFHPLGSEWTFTFDSVGILYEKGDDLWAEAGEVQLIFPDSLNIHERASVTGLRVSVLTGEFRFDEASISNIHRNYFGVDFDFDRISLDDSFNADMTGTIILPEEGHNLPEVLKGLEIDLNQFQVGSDGSIGNISGSLEGISGEIFQDRISVSDGSLGLARVSDDLILTLGGDFQFSDAFPEGIAGKTLSGTIVFNATTLELLSFKASLYDINIDNLFGETQVRDGGIEISMEEGDETFTASLSGTVILPDTPAMPEFLRGGEVTIGSFILNGEGDLISLNISYSRAEKTQLVNGFYLAGTTISLLYDQASDGLYYDVSSTISLDDPVPESLRLTFSFADFRMKNNGELINMDAAADVPDGKLLNTFDMEGCRVTLTYGDAEGWQISLSGNLGMPDYLPGTMGDLSIAINEFTIDSSGNITKLKLRTGGINCDLFSGLKLADGSIAVQQRSGDFLFSFSGDVLLPSDVSSTLDGLERIKIQEATFSSTGGLQSFKAGAEGSHNFELFGDIRITFTGLVITEDDLSLTGSLAFPNNNMLPDGLAGLTIGLNTFRLGWDGKIKEIDAGIEYLDASIAGFSLALEDIQVNADRVSVDKANLKLPSIMGSQKLKLKNVYYDYNGKFHMEFAVPNINWEVVDFGLVLEDPDFDQDKGQITFSRTALKCPEMLGNASVALNGVKIRSSGLVVSGGGFNLPEFKLEGGMTFALKANFSLDGSDYVIEGKGASFIPGLGTVKVEASFTKKDPKNYPIGLKRAYFSFQSTSLGLPLGNSSLYMNGIRGGIAYGAPDEIPSTYRGYFEDDGTRLQLGVYIQDVTYGSIIHGTVDFWMDVENWTAALDGRMALLHGYINTDTGGVVKPNLFYGHTGVYFRFVNGSVDFWVWKDGGTSRISGSGNVRFTLPKGCFVDKTITITYYKVKKWKLKKKHKKIGVVIPSHMMTLPVSAGAEFGEFRGGHVGVKGWVRVSLGEISGTYGVFASPSGVNFGNVSQYSLYTPPSAARGLSAQGLSKGVVRTAPSSSASVYYMDREQDIVPRGPLSFDVPGTERATAAGRGSGGPEMTRGIAPAMAAVSDPVAITDVAKVIFILGYSDGDPIIKATDPTGKVYTNTTPGAEISYDENVVYMGISDPAAGQWNIEVENLEDESEYTIDVLGLGRQPDLTLTTPEYEQETAGDSLNVTGTVSAYAGEFPVISLYLGNKEVGKQFYPLVEDQQTVNGEFSLDFDLSGYNNGEYKVYASVDDGSGIPLEAESPGSIVINHSEPLKAVDNLVATYLDSDTVLVSFDDTNGYRTGGFTVTLIDQTEGTEKSFDVGPISTMDLPLRNEGGEYTIRVAAYDSYGNQSENTAETSYTHQQIQGNSSNILVMTEEEIAADLEVQGETSLSISYGVENFEQTNGALDYYSYEVTDGPSWIGALLDEKVWKLPSEEGGQINLTLTTSVQKNDGGDILSITPGVYPLTLRFYNRGDITTFDEVTLDVNVTYPAPVIEEIYPDKWHTFDETEVTIFGDHFTTGVFFYMDDTEIIPEAASNYEATFLFPAGVAPGEHVFKVVLPDGQSAQETVTVIGPSYSVFVLKSQGTVSPGTSETFFYTIMGEDRFTGSVQFNGVEDETGYFTMNYTSSVSEGIRGKVDIQAAEGTPAGDYLLYLKDDKGDLVEFQLTVSEEEPEPYIASMYPYWVYAGTDAEVLGSHFGEEPGVITIDGVEQEILDWSDGSVSFITAPEAKSGMLVLSRPDGKGSDIEILIKSSGFELYSGDSKTIALQSGESRDLMVAVRGAALPVALSAAVDSALELKNPQSEVIPNGEWELSVTVPEDMEPGEYPIKITGVSDITEESLTIYVEVKESFFIDEAILPQGMVDESYYYQLSHSNAVGSVFYTLTGGSLPEGLSLSQMGILSGTPKQSGQSSFVITAEDAVGHSDVFEGVIDVEENVWSSLYKDGGMTSFIPIEGPGEARVQWRKNVDDTPEHLIAGAGKVFLLTPSGIEARKSSTGALVYTLDGSFKDYAYEDGKVFALDEGGHYRVFEADYGNEKWNRSGVYRFILSGGNSYLWGEEGLKVLRNTESEQIPGGILLQDLDQEVPTEDEILLCMDNNLYKVGEEKIARFTEEGWENYYTHSTGITRAAAKDGEFLFTDSDNSLYLLTAEGTPVLITQGVQAEHLAFGEDIAVLYGTGGLTLIDLETGEARFTLTGGFEKAALTLDKLYAVQGGALKAINIYAGTEIWSVSDADYGDLILSGGSVYAVSPQGIALSLTGRINTEAPKIKFITDPQEASGNGGYFIRPVTLTMDVSDLETKAAQTRYSIDGGAFVDYTGPFALDEGEFSMNSAAVDTNGMRGAETMRYFRVDYTAPETTYNLPFIPAYDPWFDEPVTVSLSASDNYSGVDYTEYRIDGGRWMTYSEEVPVTGIGAHLFEYRSADKAGRVEEIQSLDVLLDFEDPTVEVHVTRQAACAIFSLTGEDPSSGIQSLEYRINGGNVQNYDSPVALFDAGVYKIAYRAVDAAGRTSPWYEEEIASEPMGGNEIIKNLWYGRGGLSSWLFPSYGSGSHHWVKNYDGMIIEDVSKDDPLYFPGFGRYNRLENLPDDLVGSYQIRLQASDSILPGRIITFEAGTDLSVYRFEDIHSQADLAGWTLEEENYDLSPLYFRNGTNLYKKTFRKGDLVEIGGSGHGWISAPVVLVSPVGAADFLITGPGNEEPLHPYESADYSASRRNAGEDAGYEWTMTLDEADPVSIGSGRTGSVTVPYVENTGELTLTVTASENGEVLSSWKGYSIENRSDFTITSPAPGENILEGTAVAVEYELLGFDGTPLFVSPRWTITEEASKEVFSFDEEGLFLPPRTGSYILRGEATLNEEISLEKEIRFTVVEEFELFTIETGENLFGESFGPHENGREYGFSVNHEDRLKKITLMDYSSWWHMNWKEEQAVSLADGADFSISLPDGWYKVSLDLILPYGGRPWITLEGDRTSLRNYSHSNRIIRMEKSVQVQDGCLNLKGIGDLQLLEMSLERLLSPQETSIGYLDDFVVVNIRDERKRYEENNNNGRGW